MGEDLLGLPELRFYDSGIPNGEYEVFANLYTSSAGRDMRYFYGYTPGDPREFSVDTVGGAGGTDQHEEYSLGMVSITDGTFDLYVQDAELLGGTYPFFGWAWVRLVSSSVTMSSDSPSMLFDGGPGHNFRRAGWTIRCPWWAAPSTLRLGTMPEGTDISVIAADIFGRTGSNLYTIAGSETVSATMTCIPGSGTLPFTTNMSAVLTNLYTGQTRRLAAHIGHPAGRWYVLPQLAGRLDQCGWRRQLHHHMEPGTSGHQYPGGGQNQFTLIAEDVTVAPYNQPPYPPAGSTDTASCMVMGVCTVGIAHLKT